MVMRSSRINRLEQHWPKASLPEVAEEDLERTRHRLTKPAWEEGLENFMGAHPKLTLAAAATLGLLVGWMVKRR